MKPLSRFQDRIKAFILKEAKPVDKFGHQERVWRLCCMLNEQENLQGDEDILFAASWLHDIGVFQGHRPEDREALTVWDNVQYALTCIPQILKDVEFPPEKCEGVLHAVALHQPHHKPVTKEGLILRDADLLEQLGAAGILRTLSKVGRDTRYTTHTEALTHLARAFETLSSHLTFDAAKKYARSKGMVMKVFLEAAEVEGIMASEKDLYSSD